MDENAMAVQAIKAHHAALLDGLRRHGIAVLSAAEQGADTEGPCSSLVGYLADEILPHAEAEEATLYKRGRSIDDLSLLVDAMVAEHESLRALAAKLDKESSAVRRAALAEAIGDLFAVHAAKENDYLLPRLVREGVSIHALLGDMHHELEG